ncbi:uncharacterized protein LOC133355640 [Lethenteron reissneri]|uniref:uncharacterized protein LOC133355640 n=1 Tax=Lethenteron reissneri TaxID=7753 RepID=UPI002AB5EB7A|nr:uncharacterized protein LOC133355640 [Lethenteron reissneri]
MEFKFFKLLLLLLAGFQLSAAKPVKSKNSISAPEGVEPAMGMSGWIQRMRGAKTTTTPPPTSTTAIPKAPDVARKSSVYKIVMLSVLSSIGLIALCAGARLLYWRYMSLPPAQPADDGGEANVMNGDEEDAPPSLGSDISRALRAIYQYVMPQPRVVDEEEGEGGEGGEGGEEEHVAPGGWFMETLTTLMQSLKPEPGSSGGTDGGGDDDNKTHHKEKNVKSGKKKEKFKKLLGNKRAQAKKLHSKFKATFKKKMPKFRFRKKRK